MQNPSGLALLTTGTQLSNQAIPRRSAAHATKDFLDQGPLVEQMKHWPMLVNKRLIGGFEMRTIRRNDLSRLTKQGCMSLSVLLI